MRPASLLHLARPATQLVTEAIAVGQAAAYYPAGFSDRVCDRLAKHRPTLHGVAELPVLLVHGIWHNQSWAVRLGRKLAEEGFTCRSVNYRTVGRDIDDAAAQVATHVRQLAARYGVDRVHVVAHSLGGVVLRTAIVRHGIGDMVAGAVTIGSPHGGSPLALRPAWRLPRIGRLIAEVAPASPFLHQLDVDTVEGTGTDWTAIYSVHDEIVPGQRGRLTHPSLRASNVEVTGVGHIGLMFNSTVTFTVLTALKFADRGMARAGTPGVGVAANTATLSA